ncbi:hypothetical protein Q8A73_014314 [Channa argus]|nr:hypothetical protein Q8A73_014314 [Channa argus]
MGLEEEELKGMGQDGTGNKASDKKGLDPAGMSQAMESYCEAIRCTLQDISPPIILYSPLLFLTLFLSPRDTKKPVSQDQLVTSRELWSGEGAEETKATAVLASWRGDKVTRSSFQAISVTSGPCPGKVDLTAERWPART